ncbi:hypothetical protein FACS189475_00390 [Betaproteobacteria bacterium]|nr:hypothetical protein FACS189475_00390 [Betaproteobacteria bacterium]
MKLNGMLSKIMDNYLCLRGISSIKALARISEINPDIQRDLLEEHKDEMKEFLERGEYAFFPEVVLSMNVGLSEDSDFDVLIAKVDSVDEGFNAKVGNVKINFKSDVSKRIDDRRQLKVAQFEFEEKDIRLSRIDGNHRLSAAEYLTNDILIPFCLIVFPSEEEAKNNSRAIFHNINSKQIPLKLEQNIKIIIESHTVFTDSILEKSQPFGLHYKFTRDLLCGTEKLDFDYFPHIKSLVHDRKYSFFADLFRYLLKERLINEGAAVSDVKQKIVNIENALKEASVTSSNNCAIVGALAYYKLADPDKYNRFLKWVSKNHIADAKNVGIDEMIRIFDKVYDNIPKKIFLARWYPASTDKEHNNAEHRLNAIKSVVEDLGLEFIDIGTRVTGTFDIRTVMYHELSQSDIFVADLSGTRHNVMVEVGYALKHVDIGRMVFYFQRDIDKNDSVPFDLSGFMYDEIQDSAEIEQKVKPRLETILENS